jgi:hypothetical protein
MTRFISVIVLPIFLLTTPTMLVAQVGDEQHGKLALEEMRSIITKITEDVGAESPDSAILMPKVPCESIEDSEVEKRCIAALSAYYDYYQFGLAHRERVIWWQHISSCVIFIVVLGLVFVGVYFAWRQFAISLSQEGEKQSSSIEVGSSGIKVSSPVLGVIILSLSLAFFYLYLVFVYPIVEII